MLTQLCDSDYISQNVEMRTSDFMSPSRNPATILIAQTCSSESFANKFENLLLKSQRSLRTIHSNLLTEKRIYL